MFLDELGARLVAMSVGQIGVSIFYGSAVSIPPGDGPFLSIHETGGLAPTRVQNTNVAHTKRPTAQVFVRAKTYQAARTMSANAYAALDGVFNTVLNGVFYLSLVARQEPTDMGLDANGRITFVFNVQAEKVS